MDTSMNLNSTLVRLQNALYIYVPILIDSQDLFNKIHPPVVKKISEPGGGIGRPCREAAAQCGGYFPKTLQRHLSESAARVSRQDWDLT
jgi:hypothetical protein